jgi:hypothetical protein
MAWKAKIIIGMAPRLKAGNTLNLSPKIDLASNKALQRAVNDEALLSFTVNFQSVSAPRSCARDEGRSLEVGLQGLASNHLKLLW